MTTEAQAVLKQALQLDTVARAELIEALFRSFEPGGSTANDAAWADEAERRIDAHDFGALGAAPADEVRIPAKPIGVSVGSRSRDRSNRSPNRSAATLGLGLA